MHQPNHNVTVTIQSKRVVTTKPLRTGSSCTTAQAAERKHRKAKRKAQRQARRK